MILQDQGTVGTCWAFSTVGNVESQAFLAGKGLESLSEEQLVDCDASDDAQTKHADCGVFGGWPYLAFGYIMQKGGLVSEEDYPYCAGTGACYPCAPQGFSRADCGPPPEYCNRTEYPCRDDLPKAASIRGWCAVDTNETALQAQVAGAGPVSVLINAKLLQFYHSGIWSPHSCDDTELDHAVLVVGYGVEKTLLGEKPYWLIKNSCE